MNHKKIAELAHVSPSTVSKALSGSGEISSEIVEKIQKIAIEAGYFKEKSKRKREYTNNKSIIIAVIVPEIISVYYASLIHSIKAEVESRGGNVAVFISDFDKEKARELLRTIIIHGTADAVIIFGTPSANDKFNIPILSVTGHPLEKYDTIIHNTERMMSEAVGFLRSLGHKKLGFAGEPLTRSKADAFRKALTDEEIEVCEEHIHTVDKRFDEVGIEAARLILENDDRPTAIIAAYDEIGIALVHELQKNGVRVPDDISVMGINNIATTSYAGIPLSTVEENFSDVCREAIEHLFNKIINETHEIKHFPVEYSVIERESTAARTNKK